MAGTRAGGLRSLMVSVRAHNGLACAMLAWAGLRRGDPHGTDLQILGMTVAVFLLVSGAHLVNDLVDRQADRINRPCRPLAKGDLSASTARRISALLCCAGLLLGLVARLDWWPWWMIWLSGGCGYSLLAKGNGWWGPFCTAAVIASLYLPGASRDGWQVADTFISIVVVYFLVFREFIKNLEDARGDGIAGYRSLAGSRLDTRVWPSLLALPLILAVVGAGLLITVNAWGKIAAVIFGGSLLVAVILLPLSRQGSHHLAGAVLKIGALSGLAQLWVMPLDAMA